MYVMLNGLLFKEQFIPDAAVQWCMFQVGRAWSNNVRRLVDTGSPTANEALHHRIIQPTDDIKRDRYNNIVSIALMKIKKTIIL